MRPRQWPRPRARARAPAPEAPEVRLGPSSNGKKRMREEPESEVDSDVDDAMEQADDDMPLADDMPADDVPLADVLSVLRGKEKIFKTQLTSFTRHMLASVVTMLVDRSEDQDASVGIAKKMIMDAMTASKLEADKVEGFQPVNVDEVRKDKDYQRFQRREMD